MTHADPYALFDAWMAEAAATEPNDPNAMSLATATADGRPSVRIVLLKGRDARGFVFYTNMESRKGNELGENPHASLLFYWKQLHRQVRVEGKVEHVTAAEADEYFASRHRISRLGAWASQQSRPLPERALLESRLKDVESRYPDAVPRPPYWSGYRLLPARIEFWQDMPYRLHDRTIYTPDGTGWTTHKLFP